MENARQILFVQGGGAGVHDEWDHRLVASLRDALGSGFEVRYPRMPNEDEPDYAGWSAAIHAELASLREGAIAVGHSIGGTIMVHALAERLPAKRIAAIVLVSAPFVGEGGWPAEGWTPVAALGAALPVGVAVHVFQGTADETAPEAHAALWAKAIPQAEVHRLAGRDHQLNDDLREVANAITSRPAPE